MQGQPAWREGRRTPRRSRPMDDPGCWKWVRSAPQGGSVPRGADGSVPGRRWLRSARRGWVRSGPKVASSRSGSANPRRLRRSSGASSCPLSPCGRRPGRGVASPGRSGSRFEGHRRCDVPSPRAEDGFVLRRASGFVPPGGSMARWLGRSIVVGSWSGLRGSGDDRRDQASLLDIFRGRGIGPAHNLPTGREALERDGPSGGQSGPPGRVVGPGNLPEGGPR